MKNLKKVQEVYRLLDIAVESGDAVDFAAYDKAEAEAVYKAMDKEQSDIVGTPRLFAEYGKSDYQPKLKG